MGSAGCGPKSTPCAPWTLYCLLYGAEHLGSQRYLRVGYGSYVDPASAATNDIPQVTIGEEDLSARQESNQGGNNSTTLTDDQRRTIPHAMLVDSVIPQ